VNVIAGRFEIASLAPIDQQRFVPPTEEMPEFEVLTIEPRGVGA
jgi:hypothetical protein